jgi:protein SCO1
MSSPIRRAGRTVRLAASAAMVASVLAACGGSSGTPMPSVVMAEAVTMPPIGSRETVVDPPVEAPPLVMIDQDGKPFDLESLRGSGPVFVYFGYTHCPDVCPTTLADIRAGIKEAGVPATVVFVTVDPARDDAPAMKQYTGYYGEGYIGLTGTAVQVARAAADWGVSYRQLPSDSSNGYAMAHSTEAYLLDADLMLRHRIFFGAGSDLIAEKLLDVANS